MFTSSIGTIGRVENGLADESTAHNWLDVGGDYIRSRVAAEDLVLRYCAEKGLPGVAMCVANTFGPGDWLPTPHGGLLAAAVRGKMPFYIDGYDAEVVGIEDAAEAMVLAGERGRIGERYIVSERFMSTREIHEIACNAVGVAPPKWGIPIRTDVRGRSCQRLRRPPAWQGHQADAAEHPADAHHDAAGSLQGRPRARVATSAHPGGDRGGCAFLPRRPPQARGRRGAEVTIALTPEQQQLAEAVTQFAARHAPIEKTRRTFDTLAAGELPQWWDDFVVNGFHAVHLPEEIGGQGGTLMDTACVVEAAATALLSGPVLSTVTAGAVALLADDTPGAREFVVPACRGCVARRWSCRVGTAFAQRRRTTGGR